MTFQRVPNCKLILSLNANQSGDERREGVIGEEVGLCVCACILVCVVNQSKA